MGNESQVESRYHITYVHNALINFYKNLLDYFSSYLYPRFEWKLITTYQKAIEYLNKKDQLGIEARMPNLPAIVLNPSGDFDIEETYGKMLWRFPNLYPGFIKRIIDPIYQDENIIINVGFSRIKGECEVICLLPSFYELIDLKLYLNLIFGGKERYIIPKWFNGYFIIPEEIYNYEYENDINGQSYKINIPDSEIHLIKTTNKSEVVFPFRVLPKFKMTSMTDGSVRLGGSDRHADWRLSFSIEYEVELPTFLILESDYLAKNIKLNIGYNSCFTKNEFFTVPSNEINMIFEVDHGLKETEDSDQKIIPPEVKMTELKQKEFVYRFFHIVKNEESFILDTSSSHSNILIMLPENLSFDDPEDYKELILINGKYGPLSYYDHYEIMGNVININNTITQFEENDIIEIYIFKYIITD